MRLRPRLQRRRRRRHHPRRPRRRLLRPTSSAPSFRVRSYPTRTWHGSRPRPFLRGAPPRPQRARGVASRDGGGWLGRHSYSPSQQRACSVEWSSSGLRCSYDGTDVGFLHKRSKLEPLPNFSAEVVVSWASPSASPLSSTSPRWRASSMADAQEAATSIEGTSSALANTTSGGVVLTEAQLGNMALRAKQQRTKAEQDKQLLQARASHHPELPLRNQENCWLSLSPAPRAAASKTRFACVAPLPRRTALTGWSSSRSARRSALRRLGGARMRSHR